MIERQTTLAAFIRSQAALVSLPGGKVVQGVGDVRLNNEEALLCAEALENIVATAQVEAMGYGEPKDLEGKIRKALNRVSRENESHTPDFILAGYLLN